MRTVVRKFKDEKNIPREELGCGHVITDRDLYYGNETATKIKALGHAIAGTASERRCYRCGVEGAR
jgi:hypothetical protein